MTGRTVVIGVGNPERGDDAAGLAVARLVAPRLAPGVEVRVQDGEAARLLDAWREADLAVVVDAVCSGAPPGTVHRFEGDAADLDLPEWAGTSSTHALGIAAAFGLGRVLGRLPGRLVVLGIEGGCFDTGTPLTPAVAHAVDQVAAEIVDTLAPTGEDDS